MIITNTHIAFRDGRAHVWFDRGPFKKEDHPRGGNPDNPGQFSKGSGTGAAEGKEAKPKKEHKPRAAKTSAEPKTEKKEPKPKKAPAEKVEKPKATRAKKPAKAPNDLMRQVHELLAQHSPELAARVAEQFGINKPAKKPRKKKGAPRLAGEARKVVTPDGKMEVEAQPEIVELADLIHAEGDLQPRDRTTKESQEAVRERAKSLDPEQLQPGRLSDAGAPMVAADGTIISGNGRVMSIREAYENGELSARSKAYKKALGAQAKGMKQPVLVMRLPADMTHEQLAEFADRSNRSRIESMSATERAKRDAKAMGGDVAALYQGGDFTSPANQKFLHAFTMKAMTANERSQFSKGGKLTKEGADRMSAAVLASAYDDVDALSLMLESTDDNVRSITSAMRDTAGRYAQLKAGVAAGHVKPDMDITDDISSAAMLVSHLRKKGVSPANHFAQIDIFDRPNPMVEALVRAFYNDKMDRAISQKKITAILDAYVEEAEKHQPGGFLPDETKSSEVLAHASKKARQEEQQETNLFGGSAGGHGGGASKGGGGNEGRKPAKAGGRTKAQGKKRVARKAA